LRLLASTFKQGDLEKILQAMRSLPYDRLLLIGMPGIEDCEDAKRLRHLEGMAGHEVEFEVADEEGFMDLVGQVAGCLAGRVNGRQGAKSDSVVLNISGGSKLLGDAALLAAFELGVEAYHVNGRVTRLPIIQGATARDRFTRNQARMLEAIGQSSVTLDGLAAAMGPISRQAVDRIIRELKKENLISSKGENGKVTLWLTPPGLEILRAVKLTQAG
jgi:predicted transcriptional regulator